MSAFSTLRTLSLGGRAVASRRSSLPYFHQAGYKLSSSPIYAAAAEGQQAANAAPLPSPRGGSAALGWGVGWGGWRGGRLLRTVCAAPWGGAPSLSLGCAPFRSLAPRRKNSPLPPSQPPYQPTVCRKKAQQPRCFPFCCVSLPVAYFPETSRASVVLNVRERKFRTLDESGFF